MFRSASTLATLTVIASTALPSLVRADDDRALAVEAAAQVNSSTSVTIAWKPDFDETAGNYAQYDVSRRVLGTTGWPAGTSVSPGTWSFTDSGLSAGTVYEYRIHKAYSTSYHGSYNGYGYLQVTTGLAFTHSRGRVLLFVEQSIANSINNLSTLVKDLAADGWYVSQITDFSSSATPDQVRQRIIQENGNGSLPAVKAVFLLGHLPIPLAGPGAPDGHTDQARPLPADGFYGDLDGNWGTPSNGVYPFITLPSAVELAVGRVDFDNLPVVGSNQVALIQQYIAKDHDFRYRASTAPLKSLVGDSIGWKNGEDPAADAYRNFAPLVGIGSGTLDIAQTATSSANNNVNWISMVSANPYLWVWAGGAGGTSPTQPNRIQWLGDYNIDDANNIYNPVTSADVVSRHPRGRFYFIFGSYHCDWDGQDAFMRVLLATPEGGLASTWGGRPYHVFQGTGAGETLGEAIRRSENVTSSSEYFTASPDRLAGVHMGLMGDPTLRIYPKPPVTNLQASASGTNATVTWTAPSALSGDTLNGYYVYRATAATGPFTLISGSNPYNSTSYVDSPGTGTFYYMVRSAYTVTSPSAKYDDAGQGVISTAVTTGGGGTPPNAPSSLAGSAPSATTVSLQWADNASDETEFQVERAPNGGSFSFLQSVGANTTTATDTTVTGGTTYQYRVRAHNGAGDSTYSNTITVTTPTGGTDHIWFDDALPNGAGGLGTEGDTWNWITANPTPISGTKAHESAAASGVHRHWFGWGDNLPIATGDNLFVWVYLDPTAVPREIMLQLSTNTSWEHRIYWGENLIAWGTDGTVSRHYGGALPAAGGWVKLVFPASAVGMENDPATGAAFIAYDGRVVWDAIGTTTSSGGGGGGTVGPGAGDTVWFSEALPNGAGGQGTDGDTWNWVTSPAGITGSLSHESALNSGVHRHWYGWGDNLQIVTGDKLFVYVYLDPANPPREIMLQLSTNTSWEHRVYWGENLIPWGTDGTVSRYYGGPLPTAGGWARLEVPASAVGMENDPATGAAFIAYDGHLYWDAIGKHP